MNPFPIVAVDSSAGDLAVVELLSALPARWDEVFIIVQHFDPGRCDMLLHDALARATSHPVLVAHDGVEPQRGCIYVMRANVALSILGGRIRLSPGASASQGPGDTLFTSLAADRGAGAIGVVLSGGGSDGALGIQAIKRAGGTTFAQYPGSARFPSMPISAIETGCVGSVLRPNEIAHELTHVSRLNPRPKEIEDDRSEVFSSPVAQPVQCLATAIH
jgi:two-component system, chemotaxis family, CheB/CheR fusion protein